MNEPMTLIERLRNPQWIHSLSCPPMLDNEQTLADMSEAAAALKAALPLMGVQRPDRDAIKDAVKAGHWFHAFTSDEQVGAVEVGSFLDEIAAAVLTLPHTGQPMEGWREFLDDVITWDQKERRKTVEVDPAGNTYESTFVDGPLARRARAMLSAAPASPRAEGEWRPVLAALVEWFDKVNDDADDSGYMNGDSKKYPGNGELDIERIAQRARALVAEEREKP